ncbi:hypothetical protein HDU76_008150, partial [Blyttiomyces sp. JEL0837]
FAPMELPESATNSTQSQLQPHQVPSRVKILLLNGSQDRETEGYTALDFILAITDALNYSCLAEDSGDEAVRKVATRDVAQDMDGATHVSWAERDGFELASAQIGGRLKARIGIDIDDEDDDDDKDDDSAEDVVCRGGDDDQEVLGDMDGFEGERRSGGGKIISTVESRNKFCVVGGTTGVAIGIGGRQMLGVGERSGNGNEYLDVKSAGTSASTTPRLSTSAPAIGAAKSRRLSGHQIVPAVTIPEDEMESSGGRTYLVRPHMPGDFITHLVYPQDGAIDVDVERIEMLGIKCVMVESGSPGGSTPRGHYGIEELRKVLEPLIN